MNRIDIRKLTDEALRDAFRTPMVASRIVDQFGRPIYTPTPMKKIGDTITVKRPTRFCEAVS